MNPLLQEPTPLAAHIAEELPAAHREFVDREVSHREVAHRQVRTDAVQRARREIHSGSLDARLGDVKTLDGVLDAIDRSPSQPTPAEIAAFDRDNVPERHEGD